MSSEIKADKWSPASGTSATIGDSGDTYTIPSGVTLNTSSATLSIPSTVITSQTEKSSLADADKFLISDSAASGALKYVQKSNLPSGIYNQVANVTISDGDSIEEIQSIFTSTYRNYMILFERIAVNTNSADLELKFIKSDGSVPSEHTFGASYIDSASYSARWGGVNASSVTVMQGQGQGAGKHVSGYMYCFDMNSATDGVQRYTWLMSARHHSSSNGVVYGGGNVATNTARTGIKLTVNSGTMFGGRIVVYGITNPS